MLGLLSIDQLQIGDTLLYDKDSEISSTIDLITRSRVGHAAIVTSSTFVHEAQPQGYIKTDILKSCERCFHVYVKRPYFEYDKQKLVNWCVLKEGTKYDFKGTLWQQLKRNLLGIKIKHNDASKLYCSEADLRAYNEAAGELFNPNQSPGDILYNFIYFETYELKFK